MSRWTWLLAGGLGVVVSAVAAEPSVAAPADASLRDLGTAAGLTLGVAVGAAALNDDPAYAALAGRHFHVLVPENAWKWGHIEWQAGQRDTRALEQIVGFARAHQQQVRGHALVWDREIPAWVNATDAGALHTALAAHMQATLRRDGPEVFVWDVVNEALGPDGALATSVLQQQLGPAYVEQAFRRARAEAPTAQLFYNDFAVLWPGPKADGLVRLVDDLKRVGAPIDGVGLQSHIHLVPEGRLDWPGIQSQLRRLGERGLALHLSEVDVRVADLAGGQQGRLLAQAETVYRLVSVCRQEPACTHVAFWGVTDRYSWIDKTTGPDDPLLWDDQAHPKPAFFAVQDALEGRPWRGCRDDLMTGGRMDVTGGKRVQQKAADGPWTRVLARTETWHGPQLDVGAWIVEGLPFRFEATVRSEAGAPLQWTLRVVDGGGTRFVPVGQETATGAWQTLTGEVQVDLQPPVRSVHAYVEGPPAGVALDLKTARATVACGAGLSGGA